MYYLHQLAIKYNYNTLHKLTTAAYYLASWYVSITENTIVTLQPGILEKIKTSRTLEFKQNIMMREREREKNIGMKK